MRPRKDHLIQVRVHSAHFRAWREVARADGRSLSEWLRWLADRHVEEIKGKARTPRVVHLEGTASEALFASLDEKGDVRFFDSEVDARYGEWRSHAPDKLSQGDLAKLAELVANPYEYRSE